MKYLILPLLLFVSHSLLGQTNKGIITVEVKNYKKVTGNMMVSIYNSADGFPTKPEKAFQKFIVPIKTNKFEYSFYNIPSGTYAVAVIHDENGNQDMDSNFMGIPKEGIGTSNDAKGNFGPPKFADAKFEFNGTTKRITINLIYL
ncbi:MAG: DUF2141 domain-containing protein [Cytophagales bacterium]|nr:DUF2141 domain-containing protein [Cytophagales bacterium]